MLSSLNLSLASDGPEDQRLHTPCFSSDYFWFWSIAWLRLRLCCGGLHRRACIKGMLVRCKASMHSPSQTAQQTVRCRVQRARPTSCRNGDCLLYGSASVCAVFLLWAVQIFATSQAVDGGFNRLIETAFRSCCQYFTCSQRSWQGRFVH